MRIAVRTIQAVVGVLFIVSGLVKANDPLGLGYKMQEFFELWSSGLSGGHFFARQPLIAFFGLLHEHALFLSVVMITLEIITGVALLLGWRKKLVLYLLLVLIVFFTFLTGYAYLSGKFTNCGCFGDCLPITPLTSFTKDVVLLVLIVLLLAGRRYLQPLFAGRTQSAVLAASLVLSLLLQWYVLTYLPLVDCLPFKKNNNLAAQMKPPPGSAPDSIAIRFIYTKGGKRFEFAPEQLPPDFDTYTYVDRVDRLVRKGNAEPAIKGFSLIDTSGRDAVPTVLSEPEAVLVFALDLQQAKAWIGGMKQVATRAQALKMPVYFATSDPAAVSSFFAQQQLSVPVFACDFTVIRTAARTNPVLYLLHSGTVVEKFGAHELDKAASRLKTSSTKL